MRPSLWSRSDYFLPVPNWVQSRRDIERSLGDPGLPHQASAVIRRVVRAARLWPRERCDVTLELVSHFLDGRDAGESSESLIESFGDPGLVAGLIGRAKRRQRPVVWRAAKFSVGIACFAAIIGAGVYLGSAASLYLRDPANQVGGLPSTVEARVARAHDWWRLSTCPYYDDAVVAQTRIDDLDAAVHSGDIASIPIHVASAIEVSESLREHRTISADLLSARIESAIAHTLIAGTQEGMIVAHDSRLSGLEDLLGHTVRLEGVRHAFNGLLNEMYAVGGHLTGAGIDVMRELENEQSPSPSLLDQLMEPVRYAFPASRSEVLEQFELLLAIAERPDLNRNSQRSVVISIGLLKETHANLQPLTIVLPDLADVLEATEEAGHARLKALRGLQITRASSLPLNG